MWGGNENGRRNLYRIFLTGAFFLTSCFTLLYFFVFTESYADFRAGFSGSDQCLIQEAAAASVDGNNKEILPDAEKGKENSGKDTVQKFLPCGIPVGIYLETKGVLVTEVSEVSTSDGKMLIPCSNVIEAGDYILRVGNTEITSKEQFRNLVRKSGGKSMNLTIEHDGKQKKVKIRPVKTDSNQYMAGLWVRDNMHGIGTLTWLDEEGNFAALGHCISDIDTGRLMEIDNGQLYRAEIYSLVKGSSSQPGSLTGAIDYRMKSCIGTVRENTEQGIFGAGNQEIRSLILEKLNIFYQLDSFEALWEKAAREVASVDDIHDGKAQMVSSFNGEYRFYEIEIHKISGEKAGYENINMEITVTDNSLLKQTGGILQGMSGSPILQNGKLVGAVTHVLVNDPTRGYGIFIENMLEAAE